MGLIVGSARPHKIILSDGLAEPQVRRNSVLTNEMEQKKEQIAKSPSTRDIIGYNHKGGNKEKRGTSSPVPAHHVLSLKNFASSKNIEEFLKMEKKSFQKLAQEPRLLILGSSDSGKSTFLKQLRILHSSFTPEQREETKFAIYSNIAQAVITLFEGCKPDEQESLRRKYENILVACGHLLVHGAMDNIEFIIEREKLKAFWVDRIITKHWDASLHGLPDTTPYFMNDIARLLEATYRPSDQDILNARQVTKQVTDTILQVLFIIF